MMTHRISTTHRSPFAMPLTMLLMLTMLVGQLIPMMPAMPAVLPAVSANMMGVTGMVPDMGKLPLSFVPNVGQMHDAVQYQARAMGGTLFFTQDEIVLARVLNQPADGQPMLDSLLPPRLASQPTDSSIVRIHFDGANPSATMHHAGELPGKVNMFLGNDPSQWQRDIPTYAGIAYHHLYPGVHLLYTGTRSAIKGTYTVAPAADPSQIRWRYAHAKQVTIDPTSGELHIVMPNGEMLTEQPPVAWQTIDGQRVHVPTHYTIAPDKSVGFALGSYDPTYPLIIDPTLQWSTYLGGSGNDVGHSITMDNTGNIYLTGYTKSSNFPLANAYQNTYSGNADVFVTKLSSDGSTILFSTYLGGTGDDRGNSIAIDNTNTPYVTGYTASNNFPTTSGAYQETSAGSYTVFTTKLNSSGSILEYSTYLGGSDCFGNDIAVDHAGNVYIIGNTAGDFPTTTGAYQPSFGGAHEDAFVAKLSSDGRTLLYSTYIGGGGNDFGLSIALDYAENAYITGYTVSGDFPTINAYQDSYSYGDGDAFVSKLNTDGSGLIYSTYLGGSSDEAGGYDLAVDAQGQAYILGVTKSTDFPIQNAYQKSHGGGIWDATITKLSTDGQNLIYSTYWGGNGDEGVSASSVSFKKRGSIKLDSANNVYVTGRTNSTDFPTSSPLQVSNGGGYDAFIAKLNPTGTALLFSTYLGGAADDEAKAIAVDQWGRAAVAGYAKSADFPTKAPFQATLNGTSDAFVSRMSTMLGSGVFVDSGQALGSDFSQAIAMGDVDGDGDADAILVNGSGQPNRVYTNNGNGVFTDSGQTLGNSESQDVALGDIDGDGDLDIVVANWDEANTVWTNNGSGTFTNSGQNLGSGYTYGVVLGDVDNDGDLDALFADSTATYIWLNNGNGTFTQSGNSIGCVDGSDLALGDIDSDGDLDAFIVTYNAINEVWINDGIGLFSLGQTVGSSGGYSMMVDLGDIDNDGDLDAFVVNSGGQSNEVWLNNGTGTFVSNGQTLVGNNSQDIALGDVDGDSDLDAVVGNNGWDEVWLNDGTGLFTDSGQNLESHNSDGIALSDVDNDGDLDIFSAVYGTTGSTVWLNENTPLELLATEPVSNSLNVARDADIVATFNRTVDATTVTSATFTVRGEYTGVYTQNYTIAGSRVTFDALPQYKVGEEIEVTLSKGLRGQGDTNDFTPYTWQFHTAVEGGTGLFADSGQRLGNSNSWDVKLGDVDNDGDLDAFVANFGQPNKLWLNDGHGNFTDSGQSMGTTEQSREHALADIDNDGDLDAYVPSWGYDKVWVNDGTGIFTESPQDLGDENSREVKFGDLDGDGDLDVFEANWGTDKIRLNDGTGDFTTVKQDIWGGESSSVALGDIDNDGDLDAVVGNAAHNAELVFVNDGTATFSTKQTLPISLAHSVELGDLDNDHDLDIFFANGTGQADTVWMNDGTGNFTITQQLGNWYSFDVELGDYDNDGDLDAFVANYNQANVLWLNDGTGVFTDSGQTFASNAAYGIDVGDLDNDGDLDAFIANTSNQPNTVWWNMPPRPTHCGEEIESWALTTPLPQPLRNSPHQSGQRPIFYNDTMYILGGRDESLTWVDTVYYASINEDGTLSDWQTTTPLPVLTVTQFERIDNHIYLISGASSHTEVYYAVINADGTLGTWTATSYLPYSRQNFPSASYNNYLYVSGGNAAGTKDRVQYTSVKADGSLNTWTETTPLPEPLEGHSMVAYDGYLYVMAPNANVYHAPINPDGTVGTWTATTSLPKTMLYYSAFEHGGHVYIIGDRATPVYYAPVLSDHSLGEWQTTTSLPVPRGQSYVGGDRCIAYVVGGYYGTNLDTVFYGVYKPLPAVTIADVTLDETDSDTTIANIPVTLSSTSRTTSTVFYAAEDGTATRADNDYIPIQGTLTFTPSTTVQTITLQVVGDTKLEIDETLGITLTTPTNAVIEDDYATVTITNDDTPPTLSIADQSVTEGDSGQTPSVFTVSLSQVSGVTTTVDYDTTDDTATTSNNDYLAANGTLTFAPGDTQHTVTVQVVGDTIAEANETYQVQLSNAISATISDGTAVGTITNDDTTGVTIVESEDSTDVNEEGETSDTYTVQLDSQPTHDVTIAITHDSQVTLNTTTLTFTTSTWNTTQTITVTAVDDSLMEGDHTGTITHTVTSDDANYDGITIANVVATITDNDTAGVTIVESEGSTDVNEEGETSDTYTVQLDSQPTHDVTIAITHDSQVTLNTTTLTFTTSTWNTTQTITVTAVDDSSVEGDHTGTLTHTITSTDSNYNGITIDNVVANITDNDTAGVTIVESGDSTDVNEEGETSDTYTVQLDSQPTHDVTIAITHDSQVTLNTTTLTFTTSTWNTTQTITVTAVDDSSVEGDHTGTLTHTITSTDSNYNGITIDNVVANITDNDDTAGTVTLSLNTDTMPESGGSITLTATTDAAIPYPITVTLEMTGTAIMDKDYTLPSTMLVIPSNETTKTLVIQAKDDPIDEPNETLIISTTHIANGFIGTPARVVATITDDDSPPTIAPAFGDMSICEQAGTAPITMTLGQVSGKPITLTVGTIPATADSPFAVPATPHQDYTPINKTLTITAGESQASIPVPITTDNTNEFDEVFWVGLLGADNAFIGKDDMAQVTILDPPCDAARVRFSARQYRGMEAAGTVPVTITISPPLPELAIVRYTARAGGAQPGSDYHLAAGTVTIPAGQSTVVLDVPLIDDIDVEGDESFALMLKAITQGKAKIGVPAETIITIEDDDVPTAGIIRVETTEVQGGEADGQREVEVIVVREGGDGRTVTVPYSTLDGTAIAGWDYEPITGGVLTFDKDHSTRVIPIRIFDDTEIEGDHDFMLKLGTPTNGAALGTQNKATITIVDDDEERATNGVVQFGIDTAIVSEDALTLTLRVKRTGNISNPIAVGVATFDGSATTPSDYLRVSQTITFTEGQSYADIAIPIVQDEEAEGDETFTVELTNVSKGAVLGNQDRVQVTIQDDAADQEPYPAGIVQFLDDTVSVNESAGSIHLPIQRSSNIGTVKIEVSTVWIENGALPGSDYTTIKRTRTFNEGQSTQAITIPILDDLTHEPPEPFLVQLQVLEGEAKAGTRSGVLVMINDDDAPPKGSVSFAKSAYTVYENTSNVTIDVQWHKPADATVEQVMVAYATLDGSAHAGADYLHQEGTLTFTNQERATFHVPIQDNHVPDGDKTVILHLYDVPNGKDEVVPGKFQEVLLTIVDDESDKKRVDVAFMAKEYVGNETDGKIPVTIALSEPITTENKASVDYSTMDNDTSALADLPGRPGDYTPISGTLTFTPGITAQTIAIPLIDDAEQEQPESLQIMLLEARNGLQIVDPYNVTVWIQDLEHTVQVAKPKIVSLEQESPPVRIKVQRTGPTTASVVKVDYQTIDGTATAGEDYEAIEGTLTLQKGESDGYIEINILEDTEDEEAETFEVILTNVQGRGISLGSLDSTIVTIQDDDVPELRFQSSHYEVWEDVGTALITATLDRKSYASINAICQAKDNAIIANGENKQPITFATNQTQVACPFPIEDTPNNESQDTPYAHTVDVDLTNESSPNVVEDTSTLAVWDDDGPSTVNVTSHPSATMVLANGKDTVWVTATVRNRRGEVIPDQPVEFLLSPSLQAWQTEPVKTNEAGIAHFPVTMRQVYAGNVQVSVGGIIQAVPVKFGLFRLALPTVTNPGPPLPVQIALQATPSRVDSPSCLQQTAWITATVIQQQMFTTRVITQEQVSLSATQSIFEGTQPSSAVDLTTNDQGQIGAIWYPSEADGVVTVTARVDTEQYVGEGILTLLKTKTPAHIQTTAKKVYVESGGSTPIEAQITDANRLPVNCESVTFNVDFRSSITDTNTLSSLQFTDDTDENGYAGMTLVCLTEHISPTIAIITTKAGEESDSIQVHCASPDKLTVESEATPLLAKTGEEKPLTITVADSEGAVLPHQPITVSTTLGTVTPAQVKTDANGQATVALMPPPGLETGTAEVEIQSSRVVTTFAVPIVAMPQPNRPHHTIRDALDVEIGTAYAIDGDGNPDNYYRVEVAETKRVTLFLRKLPMEANYDMELRKSDGWVKVGESRVGANGDETIETTLQADEVYYLRVYQPAAASGQQEEVNYVVGGVE